MNILSDGTTEGRWTVWWDDIAGGTFISNSNEALPQFNQVNVPSLSSSVYASLGAIESDTIPARTTGVVVVTTSGCEVLTLTTHFATGTPVETPASAPQKI